MLDAKKFTAELQCFVGRDCNRLTVAAIKKRITKILSNKHPDDFFFSDTKNSIIMDDCAWHKPGPMGFKLTLFAGDFIYDIHASTHRYNKTTKEYGYSAVIQKIDFTEAYDPFIGGR